MASGSPGLLLSATAIHHDGTQQYLGSFHDEHDAARSFDAAARRLRPTGKAHGVRAGTHWLRLNFPTTAEKASAKVKGPLRWPPGVQSEEVEGERWSQDCIMGFLNESP